ncbi:carboxymuconolactone decarboxylase family protein [Rhodopseudomonas pseudopalustris]|uniref:carboxymuconolactone decarboxylase family protein n=1 Tax=Rhodopseudomonas pseudopalustris TaxID=1513892 RepID=UPI00158819F5|nr:carboxymuconolactone decarboxylase family protein [Rhodopseudomonas pseudopalustris]
MNGLVTHRVAQADFELFGLAASAVRGCEDCIKAHATGAREHGAGVQAIQSAIRIAAVIHAAATTLDVFRPGAAAEPTLSSALHNNHAKDSI